MKVFQAVNSKGGGRVWREWEIYTKKYGTLDVTDYDDPDEYASDFAEDFAYDEFEEDSWEAYEYGYEEAYDYWMDEMGE